MQHRIYAGNELPACVYPEAVSQHNAAPCGQRCPSFAAYLEDATGRNGATCIEVPRQLNYLILELEVSLGRPVVDETNLDGGFDIELTWEYKDPESLPAAVRDQLGLDFQLARREIKMFVVRSNRRVE